MAFSLFKKGPRPSDPAPADVPVVNGMADDEPAHRFADARDDRPAPAPEPAAGIAPEADVVADTEPMPEQDAAPESMPEEAVADAEPAQDADPGPEAEYVPEPHGAELPPPVVDPTPIEETPAPSGATAVRAASPLRLDELDAAAAQLSGAHAAPAAEAAPLVDPDPEPLPDAPATAATAAAVTPAAGFAGATAAPAGAALDPVAAEQARLERERAARREARLAALEPVREDDPLQPATPAAPVRPAKPSTDRFLGSLGLFVLRLVTGGTLFVHGLNGVINPRPVLETWTNTVLPYPGYVSMGVSWVQLVVGVLLVFGLFTRLGGLLAAGVLGATLAFVKWGRWSIFEEGGSGFIGEHELLLAAAGIALLCLGAGAWSFDYFIRRSRQREGLGH